MNVAMTQGSVLIRTAMATTRDIVGRWSRGDLSNLAADAVTLSELKRSVSVGVAVIRTSGEMLGTVLDVLA